MTRDSLFTHDAAAGRDPRHQPAGQGSGRGYDHQPPSDDWRLPAIPRSAWAGLFVAVFGALLIASGMRTSATHRRLEAAGITTTATVVAKQVRTLGEMEARFTIRSVYTGRDGAVHERAEDVPYSRYRRLDPGSTFPLVYDPARPSRAMPAGDLTRTDGPASWLAAGALLILSGVAFAGAGVLTRRRGAETGGANESGSPLRLSDVGLG